VAKRLAAKRNRDSHGLFETTSRREEKHQEGGHGGKSEEDHRPFTKENAHRAWQRGSKGCEAKAVGLTRIRLVARMQSAGPGQGSVFAIKLPLVGSPRNKSRLRFDVLVTFEGGSPSDPLNVPALRPTSS
jgi:hypothetical protein